VWRCNGGWWDGNPSTLLPARDDALATALCELAGGPATLCDRDESLRLAGHLAEIAWLAAPDDGGVRAVRQQVFTARADAATSTMARGVFRWAAQESAGGGR